MLNLMIYFHLLKAPQEKVEKVFEIFVLYTIIKHLLFGIHKELLPTGRKQTQTKYKTWQIVSKCLTNKQKNTFYLLAIQGMQIISIR